MTTKEKAAVKAAKSFVIANDSEQQCIDHEFSTGSLMTFPNKLPRCSGKVTLKLSAAGNGYNITWESGEYTYASAELLATAGADAFVKDANGHSWPTFTSITWDSVAKVFKL